MRICSIFSLLIHIGVSTPCSKRLCKIRNRKKRLFLIWCWFLVFLVSCLCPGMLTVQQKECLGGGLQVKFHLLLRWISIWVCIYIDMIFQYIMIKHICIYMNIYKYITTFIAEVNIYLSVCLSVCVCVRERKRVCESVCVYLCVLTYIYLQTYLSIYTHEC